MIEVKTVVVPKKSTEGGSTTIVNNTSGGGSLEGHNLWGQYFDGTQDIDGSLTVQGNVTAENGNFVYVNGDSGSVLKLSGDELDYKTGHIGELNTDTINNTGRIKSDELEATKSWLKTINSKYITTENLTVTGSAHFFELIIDKIKSVGGTLMMTQANAVIDYVKAFDSSNNEVAVDANNVAYYNVYWNAKDNNGRKVSNDWKQYDQAICMSFNNVSTGVNYDISNKYYWRLVDSSYNNAPLYLNFGTGEDMSTSTPNADDKAKVNSVTITNPTLKYIVEGIEHSVVNGWNVTVPQVTGVNTGVTWTQQSGGLNNPTVGVMSTQNTIWGINLAPIDGSALSEVMPDTFSFTCSAARLTVGIYYTDETSVVYQAPQNAATSYNFNLNSDVPVKTIVISNADEVEWRLVNVIRLSNLDYDGVEDHQGEAFYNDKNSIPSVGDNIAQLGYRYDLANDNDTARSNAIIIAAYKTPDTGTGISGDRNENAIVPPSYAQYEGIGATSGHRYELARYRKTYMDSIGSKFIGSFYTGGGTDIESLIQTGGADLYHLYIAYSHTDTGGPTNPDGTIWSKSAGTGVSWEYMGFSSQGIVMADYPGMTEEQAIAALGATLTFNDYDWSLVPGGTGTAGGHWVNAYKNTNNSTTAPTPPNVNGVAKTLSELPYDGWYETAQTLGTGEYTWMTQAFVNGSGSYDLWQTAIRLTGDKGQNGVDGNEIEFIYYRKNDDTPISAPSSVDTDGYIPTGWTNHPQGVTDQMKWEFVCQRYKTNGHWGNFIPNPAAIWSKYGENGRDGDGYEYLYANTWDTQTYPAAPPAPPVGGTYPDEWEGTDSNGTEWHDDPVGVSVSHPQEYVTMRKKSGNTGWSDYSTPALWAQYVPQGVAGRNGSYTQFIYKNDDGDNITIPEAQQQKAYIPTEWSITATTPDFSHGEYTWCSYRTVSYTSDNTVQYERWIAAYRITGDKGEQGADGDLIEFIYTTNNTGVAPAAPTGTDYPRDWPNDGTTDHQTVNGVTWYDNPQGVSANNRFEYVSSREYDGVNETWSTYSTPALWSKYGENGRDGDGIEYIYACASDTAHIPAIYTNSADLQDLVLDVVQAVHGVITAWRPYQTAAWKYVTDNDYIPPSKRTYHEAGGNYEVAGNYPDTDWTDDPQELNASDKKVEYVAQRKYNGTTKTWTNFSTPEIWAMYGGTGPQGPQGPIGPQGVNGIGYKLIDWGSQAYYSITLDNNNNESYAIKLLLKFKVAEISGNNVRFLSPTEITDLPLFPYAKSSKTTSTATPEYYWRKFSFEDAQAEQAVCVYEWPTDESYTQAGIQNLIKYNNNIYVALLPATSDSYRVGTSATNAMENRMKDEVCIPLKLLNSAELQVTSGQNASIKALVTGQEGLSNNVTSLTLGVQGIQGQVNSLNQGIQGMQSTISQMPDQIKSQVTSWYNESGGYAKTTTIDLTSQDTKKFYPVAVTLPNYAGSSNTEKAPRVYIKVCRLIDSTYGGPDYSTHIQSSTLDGFPFNLQFSTQPSGNGNIWSYDTNKIYNGEPLFINKLEVSWTKDINGIPKDCIAYKIDQNYMGSNTSGAGNDEIIFLRGGSKYDISSTWVGSTITPYTSGYSYTHGNGSTFERPVMSYDSDIPYIKQDEMTRSEIIQTADQISLSVYSGIENDLKRTGIDITKGEIDLVADNTTVKGDLNIRSSNNGAITLYDNNDQPRINIKPQNVPVPISGGNNFSSTGTISLVSSTVSGSTTTVTTGKVSLGNYSSGQSISLYIHPRLYGLLSSEGYYMENNAAQITCTAKIYRGSNTSASYTTTHTINRTGSNDYTAFTWNVNLTAGSNTVHKLEISITATNNGYSSYYGSASVTYDKIVDSLTYVGADGILVGTSINNFASITKDGFEFRWVKTGNTYDGTSIRMSDNGFQRANRLSANNNPVSWVAFDGHEPITVLYDSDFNQMSVTYGNTQITRYAYIVKASDVNIFIDRSLYYNEVWILLGDGIGSTNACDVVPGRKLRIKNLSGKTVQIGTGYANEYIMDSNGLGLNDHIEANNRSFTLMSIPDYYNNGNECHWTIMHAD